MILNLFDNYKNYQMTKGILWTGSNIKCALTNNAPSNSYSTYSQLPDLSTANGYTNGGVALSNLSVVAPNISADNVVITPTGSIGPFRYAYLYYNATAVDIVKPLIGWVDYGESVTLATGQVFTVLFNGTTGNGIIFQF